MNDLAERLEQVGRGRPLPATGAVALLPGPAGTAVAAVLGFTAHHLIAADVDPDWLMSRLGPASGSAEIGLPMQPDFLAALGARLGALAGGQDVLLVSTGTGNPEGLDPSATVVNPAELAHPRTDRALRCRENVRVVTLAGRRQGASIERVPASEARSDRGADQSDIAGLVTIGTGLAGRWEISIEVEAAKRGLGVGRALAGYGRALVPLGALLWAQVHPANIASLRAFLAAGYRPVGAEVLFTHDRSAVSR